MRSWSKGFAGVCLLLACSCSVRKKQLSESYFLQKDSFTVQRVDSFRTGSVWQSVAEKIVHWEEVSFSAPDSNGRQYIERIRRNVSGSRFGFTRKDSLSLQSGHSVNTVRQTAATVQAKQETLKKSFAPWWLILTGGCLAGVGLIGYRYFPRKYQS